MRIAAILYIIASVTANFFIGNLTTFALAAFSFPFLVWLLVKKKPVTNRKSAPGRPAENEANNPGAV